MVKTGDVSFFFFLFSSFLLLRFAPLNLKIYIYIYIYIYIFIYYGYLISLFDLVLLAVILENLFDNNNGCFFFFTSFVFSFLNFVLFLEGNFKFLIQKSVFSRTTLFNFTIVIRKFP